MSEQPIGTLYRAGGRREFDRNSLEGLQKSLSKCHDVNQALIRSINNLETANRNLWKLIFTVAGIAAAATAGLLKLIESLPR